MSKNTTDELRKHLLETIAKHTPLCLGDEDIDEMLAEILALISNREKLARIDEGELLTSRMQKAADIVPPNLLLNEMVNIQWARKDELAALRKELDREEPTNE